MSSTSFNVSFSFPLDGERAQRLVENSLELVWQGSSEIPNRFPLLYGEWVRPICHFFLDAEAPVTV